MHTLVIGYGNRLRRDDGLGPAVAEAVAAWQLPGVWTLAVHQLVPELVEELQEAEQVLFVDASKEPMDSDFTACRLEPKSARRSLGHHEEPANLLALAHALLGSNPDAWLLAIAPHSLEYGENLTEIAQARLQTALAWLRQWLTAKE